MIFDCFMLNDELDILECRLEELSDVVDVFVIVEAQQNHLGKYKPFHLVENSLRFQRWTRQIRRAPVLSFRATDSREREHEQREAAQSFLKAYGANPDDIVIQSDVDEIPSASSVRALAQHLVSHPLVALEQRPHYHAVDWLYPKRCDMAPAAARFQNIDSFWKMRRASFGAPLVPNGGWHFSWLGGCDANLRKLGSIYEGPEIEEFARPLLESERCRREGIHVDGVRMTPVEVDATFPAYIRERRCPESWFRPR